MRFLSKYCILFLLFGVFFSCKKDESNNINKEYEFLFEKARDEYKYGKIGESYITFKKLISISDNVINTNKNQRIHLIALNYLGDIFLKSGEKKLAYKEFERALSLAEDYNNEQYQILAILNIVKLEDDLDKVESLLQDTNRKFGSNQNNKFSLDQIKIKLGLLYSESSRSAEAIHTFKELLENINYDNNIKSEFNKGMGIAYKNQNNFKLANEYFERALNLAEDRTFRKLKIFVEKAEVYSLSKEYEKYEKLMTQIMLSIDTIPDLNLKKRISELQLEVYNQTNNTDGKIDALSELLSLNEKIYEKSNAALGSIAVNLKNYELKKENEFQKEVNKSQKEVNNLLKISLLLASLIFLLALLLFYNFHKRKTQIQLLEKEQAYKDLQNEIALESMNAYTNGQEEERKEHAAKLHDSLGANLAAVNMHLSLLKKDVPQQKYERISGILKNVIVETRNISHNIMPPILVNQGVIAAITERALDWTCPTKLQFEVVSNVEKVNLDGNLEIALYRGILECMSNTMNRSEATEAQIIFEQLENNVLYITIKDNGKGFDVGILERGEGGLGLNGLKNRIKYFKGNVDIQSEIGNGTFIQINVPIMKMKKTA